MRINSKVVTDIESGKVLERIAQEYAGPIAKMMGVSRMLAFVSSTVVASPAAAAETAICTLPAFNPPSDAEIILLIGWCALTIGTNGVSCRLRIEQGAAAGGTNVGDSGLVTVVAASLFAPSVMGVDTPGAVDAFQYTLTATIGSGSASSTVSKAVLAAFCL